MIKEPDSVQHTNSLTKKILCDNQSVITDLDNSFQADHFKTLSDIVEPTKEKSLLNNDLNFVLKKIDFLADEILNDKKIVVDNKKQTSDLPFDQVFPSKVQDKDQIDILSEHNYSRASKTQKNC